MAAFPGSRLKVLSDAFFWDHFSENTSRADFLPLMSVNPTPLCLLLPRREKKTLTEGHQFRAEQ